MCFEAQSHESVLKRLRPELGALVASIHRESEKRSSRKPIYEILHSPGPIGSELLDTRVSTHTTQP
jgi:hypothetical protein